MSLISARTRGRLALAVVLAAMVVGSSCGLGQDAGTCHHSYPGLDSKTECDFQKVLEFCGKFSFVEEEPFISIGAFRAQSQCELTGCPCGGSPLRPSD